MRYSILRKIFTIAMACALPLSANANIINNTTDTKFLFGGFDTGSHSIKNSALVLLIVGSANTTDNITGGANYIKNRGLVGAIVGSANIGDNIVGGSNTIINSGCTLAILGSINLGNKNVGGSNIIKNPGGALVIIGSTNIGYKNVGGSNIINNSGSTLAIVGSVNLGFNNTGGSNIITNTGTTYYIIGSLNLGSGNISPGNTITNYGTVLNDIYGNLNIGSGARGGNDIIYNYGVVNGNIYGADGDDTVIIGGGSTLKGFAYGGTGTDMLGFDNMGTVDGSVLGTKYISFENIGIFGGTTEFIGSWALNGGQSPWYFSGYKTYIYSGNLYVNGTLSTDLLTVYPGGLLGGSGRIYSDVIVYGTVSPGNSMGTLTANSYTFMLGSALNVEIFANGKSDVLYATETVQINGGTVYTSVARDLYLDGDRWVIIKADGGVSGRFDSLITGLNSETLSLKLKYASKNVSLEIERTPFETFGTTANQQNAGSGLDKLLSQASGDMESMIISMDFDMNRSQIQNTLNALVPEMYSSFGYAGILATQESKAEMI